MIMFTRVFSLSLHDQVFRVGSTDSSDGIDFTNNCSCDVTTQFWTQFSREFARSASGVTFYMGDGESMDGAFRNNSFFATEELPFMPAGVVTHVVALVIHEKGKGINK